MKKIALNKDTLRQLDNPTLHDVVGGGVNKPVTAGRPCIWTVSLPGCICPI